MTDYSVYLPTAKPKQAEAIRAVLNHRTQADAANALGVNLRTLERRLSKAKGNVTGDNMPSAGRTHCMIPDCQVTPTTPTNHLEWIGEYIAEKKPDVIVNIGDFADFESLSSYDKGKKSSEGRRVLADFDAANKANRLLCKPFTNLKGYNPEMHFTLGNHENRVNRAVELDASLDGFLTLENLNYKDTGWTVHQFLDQVVLDGVSYSHFFANPMTGRPYGGYNLDLRLKTIGYSFSMGHQQFYATAIRALGNGRIQRGLVHGSCYLHDEDYKGKQGNTHKRGIVMKNEVFDGDYDVTEVSLDFLCRKYEGMPVSSFMKRYYSDIFANSEWLQRMDARR